MLQWTETLYCSDQGAVKIWNRLWAENAKTTDSARRKPASDLGEFTNANVSQFNVQR